jgi:hypothetical protein
MAIEYLLVTFPEQRAVLADDAGVGFTNHTLMLPGDEYTITLEGGGCRPAAQVIALAGTSIVKPMVVAFASVPAVASAGSASDLPAPLEADVSATMGSVVRSMRKPSTAGSGARPRPGTKSTAKTAAFKPSRKAKKNA